MGLLLKLCTFWVLALNPSTKNSKLNESSSIIVEKIEHFNSVLYWDMEEEFGQIKVTVIRGNELVIRDFKTSDPYVILKLGNQTAKTKVINSCLNPTWNEEFCFCLSEPVGVLKLEVFDKDRFKADDKMGNAQINLQPLAAAARLRQILGVATNGTTLRKMIPETDNCLAADSSINWENGEVVQDVWLRLCDVESGEIELKIKLIKLPPVSPPK